MERINVLEIKQNRLRLNIDGVPEDDSVRPALLIMNKYNNETDAELTEANFKSAWRVPTPRKKNNNTAESEVVAGIGVEPEVEAEAAAVITPGKLKRKPRTISVILESDTARDKIMSNRSKLLIYDDGTSMLITEDQPEAYRRRKMMLRDLVKLAGKKGYKDAKVMNGGIRVGGILYTPDKLDNLPEAIKPK